MEANLSALSERPRKGSHYRAQAVKRQYIPKADGRQRPKGGVIAVRYADDFVIGFQSETDAKTGLAELREWLAAFNLELHPEKTRLIEFGRYARANRQRKG